MVVRIIKYLAAGLLGVLALSFVLVLVLVGFNLFDEDLDPNVRDILSSNVAEPPDGENAFFSMLALSAPAGEEIHTAGIRVVNKYQKSLGEADEPERELPDTLFGSNALEFAGDLDGICLPREGPPCLRFCCAPRTALAKLIADNDELLRRYESLYTYPYYHAGEKALFGHSDVLKLQRLKLAEIADSHSEGQTHEALQAIQKDIGFWRSILGSEMNAVFYSLVGVAVSNNLILLSELLLSAELSDLDQKLLEEILLPLTDKEKSVNGIMVAEIRQLHSFNRSFPDSYDQLAPGNQPSILRKLAVRIFYRPNATLNFFHSEFSRMIRNRETLPHPPDSNYWRSDSELDAAEYLYNPIGKAITDWMRRYPQALDASLRADSRYRLVALQLQLRDSQIPEAEVDEFLLAAPAYFTNPFTGEKIQWEGEKKRLIIRVPNPRYIDEIWVDYCNRSESLETSAQAENESRLGYCG